MTGADRTVWALLCVAERRATRQNGEWGPGIVLAAICWATSAQRRCHPQEALHLPTFSHLLIVNKLFSLSLSLSRSLARSLARSPYLSQSLNLSPFLISLSISRYTYPPSNRISSPRPRGLASTSSGRVPSCPSQESICASQKQCSCRSQSPEQPPEREGGGRREGRREGGREGGRERVHARERERERNLSSSDTKKAWAGYHNTAHELLFRMK